MSTLMQKFIENFWGIRPFKRHSLVLMIAGIVYMLQGAVYIFSVPTSNRLLSLSVALNYFPMEFWGSLFIITGLLAFISSRWPPVAETWGYTVLAALSTGWGATYAAGVIFEQSPVDNLTGAINWALWGFVWWAISGFVNPDKTIVVVINDERADN